MEATPCLSALPHARLSSGKHLMGKSMRRHTRLLLLALLACITATSPAVAEDKPFPRKGTVLLLGYDPEAPLPATECEKRSNIAGLIRVALVKEKPPAQQVPILLNVGGLLGSARAVCPADKVFSPLRPLTEDGRKLDAASCKAAIDTVRGPLAENINRTVDNEHVDVARGFIDGVAQTLAPIAKACDPGDHWAQLKVQVDVLTGRAASMTKLRSCLLWRKAGFQELGRARDLAYSHGRAAGQARLDRQAMAAIAGARHYCGKDEIAEAFEKMQYDLTVALIAAAPVTPEPAKKN